MKVTGEELMSDINLFEKYGGFYTVQKLINAFYEDVLASDIVSHHFDGVDMPGLIEHQTDFISMVMGAPVKFDDSRLVSAHQNLNITEAEWDEVVRILIETLVAFEVEQQDIDALTAAVASKKPLIVSQ